MSKIQKSFYSLFRLNGFYFHFLIFLIIFFSLEVFQGSPTMMIDADEFVSRGQPLSLSGDGGISLGGNRPEFLEGQKISILLTSSKAVNITIVQSQFNFHTDDLIYVLETNIVNLDRSIEVISAGDIKAIIVTNSTEAVHIEFQIIRSGYATPLLIYFILISLIIIIMSYFKFRSKPTTVITQHLLLRKSDNHSKLELIRIYFKYFSYHQIVFVLIFPAILISIDPQIGPYSTSIYSNIDEYLNTDDTFDMLLQAKYFSAVLIRSSLNFILYALPITLFMLIFAMEKDENQNEMVYPINKSLWVISRALSFTLYLTIIPVLDLLIRIYVTDYYNTLDITYFSLFLSLVFTGLFIFTLVSIYFVLFDFVEIFFIRLVIPIILFMIFVGFDSTPIQDKPFFDSILSYNNFGELIATMLILIIIFSSIFIVNVKLSKQKLVKRVRNFNKEKMIGVLKRIRGTR